MEVDKVKQLRKFRGIQGMIKKYKKLIGIKKREQDMKYEYSPIC